MSDVTLKFNSTDLRTIASEMDTTIEDFKNDLKRIDDVCAKLKNAWTGATADEYYTKVVEKNNSFREIEWVLGELPGHLRYIANLLDEGKANL